MPRPRARPPDRLYVAAESRLDTLYTLTRGDQTETRRQSNWIFTLGETTRMLAAAGLDVVGTYATLDKQPFALGSQYLYLVAMRAPGEPPTPRKSLTSVGG